MSNSSGSLVLDANLRDVSAPKLQHAQTWALWCRWQAGSAELVKVPPLFPWVKGYVQVTTIATCLKGWGGTQLDPPPGSFGALLGHLLWEGSPVQACRPGDAPPPRPCLLCLLSSCCLRPRTPSCGSGD